MRRISYDPLWKKLIDLKMTKTEMQEKAEISRSTLAKMRKNEYVALEVIEKIANALDCDVVDILSILPSENT
jgi:DNA-binding Xre family transcriptional regulator